MLSISIPMEGLRLFDSDFTVKIVDVESSEQCTFQGHTAPILSVALHPRETYLVSDNADVNCFYGSLRYYCIWMYSVVLSVKCSCLDVVISQVNFWMLSSVKLISGCCHQSS